MKGGSQGAAAGEGATAVGTTGARGNPPSEGVRGDVSNTPATEETPADTGPVETSLKRMPDFAKPPASYRLKTRSGASASTLQELSKSGFGAVEGGGIDASVNTSLQAAKSVSMSVDLAPGGSMPYAAPEISEADSMQQLSRAVSAQLTSDGTLVYNQAPPRLAANVLASSPTLKLVAVTAARVVESSGMTTMLYPESAVDLTPMVSASGQISWTVPAGNWLVFGFWERATGQTPNGYPPFQEPSYWSAQVPAAGGFASFIADIFSGVGIGKALAGLDSLPAATLDLLKGTQFAHDSLEVQAEMFWTSKLPAEFSTRRGYSMIPYLPALHTPKEASFDPLTKDWGITPPLEPEYDFVNDVGARARYDYHLTLNDLYVGEYLKTFTETLNKHGMQSRVQVAYNYKPLNMTRAGVAVDIPENESFDSGWGVAGETTVPTYPSERWRHAMDSYRLTGSGAHLGKGKRATLEFGDDFAMYRKQPIDYAQQLNEACAGGITMGLLTGFAGVSTGWPAGGGLGIGIGDFWTTAWPQWRDWTQLADYFARSTLVLETGKPLMDAVIFLDEGISGVHA